MKINTDKLVKSLTFLRDIIPQNPHIQTFAYLHMSVENDRLLLRGMNIGKYAELYVDVEDSDNFEDTLVPMTKFYNSLLEVRKLSVEIVLKSNGKHLSITFSDGSRARIALIDANEFPDRVQLNKTVFEFKIDSGVFTTGLTISNLAGGQFIMTQNIHLFSDGERFTIEATNGYSGGKVVVTDCTEVFDVAVVADFDRIIRKAAKMFPDEWSITITKNHFVVNFEDTFLIAYSTSAEKYLDISKMYTNTGITKIKLSRADFLTNINIINALSESAIMVFTVKDGLLTVTAENAGDAREYSLAVGDTGNSVIKLQVKELLSILNSISGEDVWLEYAPRERVLIYDNDLTRKYFIVTQA